MTQRPSSAPTDTWTLVDRERRIDRFIRRVSIAAWIVVFLIGVLFTVMTGLQVAQFFPGATSGEIPWMVVVGLSMPLIITVGLVSVLVATLATIGVFLRLRTASLNEIQLRLAALEAMLADERREKNGAPTDGERR
jgi:hypothetical protein